MAKNVKYDQKLNALIVENNFLLDLKSMIGKIDCNQLNRIDTIVDHWPKRTNTTLPTLLAKNIIHRFKLSKELQRCHDFS